MGRATPATASSVARFPRCTWRPFATSRASPTRSDRLSGRRGGYWRGMEADRHAAGRTPRTLVGVFHATRDAEAVRSALVAAGIDRNAIRIGDEADRMTSLKGEM